MADLEDYKYPHIDPTDYIDESLGNILARDDAAKHGFRRLSSFPSVTNDDVGMKIYIVGRGNFQLIASDPEPQWKQLSDDSRNIAYMDWIIENYQPISKLLTSLSKLRDVSNALPYFNGPEDMQAINLSGYMKNILGLTDNNEVVEALKLGSAAKLDYPIDGKYIDEGTLPLSAFSKELIQNIGFSTGDAKLTYKTTADSGWVMADDGSIGNVGSGATNRANADTYDLFKLMWNISACTLQTYAGTNTVKTTAAADWSSNKRLILPKLLGRALGVAGSGSDLTKRNLGTVTGQEKITLGLENMPKHNHGLDTYLTVIGSKNGVYNCNMVGNVRAGHSWGFAQGTRVNEQEIYDDGEGASQGNGSSFDNLQPTSFINVMIKL